MNEGKKEGEGEGEGGRERQVNVQQLPFVEAGLLLVPLICGYTRRLFAYWR